MTFTWTMKKVNTLKTIIKETPRYKKGQWAGHHNWVAITEQFNNEYNSSLRKDRLHAYYKNVLVKYGRV